MPEPLNPYKGDPPPESDETDDLAMAVSAVIDNAIRDAMSERQRKRVEYVKFRARDRAEKVMRGD